MSLLCDDPTEGILVPFRTLRHVECQTKNGGFCQNSAAQHLGEVLLLPGLTIKQYWPILRKQVVEEMKPYAKLWGVDQRRIKVELKPLIFETNKYCINLYLRDHIIAVYRIRELYDFEKENL